MLVLDRKHKFYQSAGFSSGFYCDFRADYCGTAFHSADVKVRRFIQKIFLSWRFIGGTAASFMIPGISFALSASAKICQSEFSVIYEIIPFRSILWSSTKISRFIKMIVAHLFLFVIIEFSTKFVSLLTEMKHCSSEFFIEWKMLKKKIVKFAAYFCISIIEFMANFAM